MEEESPPLNLLSVLLVTHFQNIYPKFCSGTAGLGNFWALFFTNLKLY